MSDSNLPPSYPAASSPAPAGGAPVAPPQQVNIAFWLYIVGAALSLISLIISLATIGSLKGDLQRQLAAQGQQISDSALNATVTASVTVAIVFGILYIAAYVLFAVFMRRGANWARIVLLIVTVLSLFGILGGFGLGAARVVVGVIATILIFLKPANEYFSAVKASKRPRA
ncbi:MULTISPECIES: hypothetical protein [Leifsonia]|uniref:Uncharacterized protein n=1 Tax=Leifsonia soli TaxID=582665 RepID=A0A852T2L7_9MICO|nr:hypothetical protein [Leifsonia sp. 21MFCrub1.1]NYD75886.1 hypothetical protein [Leifsonia soli]SEB06919.1 hypothetical protein SAMN04515680_2998 [Leifsonia sp. 21MFCrub1.1]